MDQGTGVVDVIESCTIRDNGTVGVDIQWATRDACIRNCTFESTAPDRQGTAIRISDCAQNVTLAGNRFVNCPVEVEDNR